MAYSHVRAATPALVEAPFKLVNGLPTIDVVVGNEHVALFIDLGAFIPIALDAVTIDASGASIYGEPIHWKDADGKDHLSRNVALKEIAIGGVRFAQLTGMEFASPTLPRSLAGYIGLGFFQNYLVVLDYPRKTLKLFGSGDTAAMVENCGTSAIPFTLVNGVIRSKVATDKGEFIFQWDTGSSENVFRPSALDAQPPVSPMLAFSRFDIAGFSAGRTIFTLREFRAPNVDGVLGADFFASRVFCIDPHAGTAALK